MKLHVRGRLFLASLAVVGVVVALAGSVAHVELRRWLEARVEHELGLRLGAARVAAEAAGDADDPLADRLGAAMGTRVTFIDNDGNVVGDSELDYAAIERIENHATRPEVAAARGTVRGRDRRESATVHKPMLYLAERWEGGAGGGVVRVAASYDDVDAAAAALRVLLAVAGALGLGVAVLLSGLASQLVSRTLRALVDQARALVGGERFGDDEIGGLAETLRKLGNDLGRVMGTLTSERDRFAAVLEAMNEGVIGLDADGRIVFVNAAARALFGAGADVVGKSILDLTREPALETLSTRARKEGVVVEGELEIAPAQPQPRPTPAPDAPAADESGGETSAKAARLALVRAGPLRAGGAVIVLHDVTDVRKLERIRRDFVANVSHELRTPISVIRANAETLLLGGLEDRGRAAGFVDAIDKHAERLSRLVGDLLDLSRLEAGQVALERAPQLLLPLAQRAVESVEVRAKERQHELRVEVPEGLAALADANALDQVLVNLLDNAVKYTPAGGHVVVRALLAGSGGERVRIEVEDDGPGVAAQHRPRLFERFYRVDKGRSRDAGGTGLGLAIVKHLVEAMGGTVGASPAPIRGTVFWLELLTPATRAHDTAPSADVTLPPEVSTASTASTALPARPAASASLADAPAAPGLAESAESATPGAAPGASPGAAPGASMSTSTATPSSTAPGSAPGSAELAPARAAPSANATTAAVTAAPPSTTTTTRTG